MQVGSTTYCGKHLRCRRLINLINHTALARNRRDLHGGETKIDHPRHTQSDSGQYICTGGNNPYLPLRRCWHANRTGFERGDPHRTGRHAKGLPGARSSHSGKGTRRGGEDAWWSASSPFLAQRLWQARGSVRKILICFTRACPATVRHDRQLRSSGDLVPCGANNRYGSRAGCGPKPFLLGVARVSYRVFYRRWW